MIESDETIKSENRSYRYLLIITALIALAYMAAGLFSVEKFWGINNLKYFPLWYTIAFGAFSILFIIPWTARLIHKITTLIIDRFRKIPLFIRICLVIMVSLAILYFFRVQVHSLGDGYLRAYQIEQGYSYIHSEPLDYLLHVLLYDILNKFTSMSGEDIYALFSIACGLIYILAVYLITSSPENKLIPVISGLLLIEMGGIQLFFGYVESYSLVYLSGILYVVLCYRFIQKQKGLLIASILLAIAVASHQSGFILLPSFAYLIYLHFKSNGSKDYREAIISMIVVSIAVIVVVLLDYRDYLRSIEVRPAFDDLILPFYSSGSYSIVSGEHLLDILNQLLLVSPFLFILTPIFAIKRVFSLKNLNTRFCIFLAIPAILFLLIIDPKLGFARDWDLFAMPAAMIGVIYILHLSRIAMILKSAAKTTLIGTALLFLCVWIGVNTSEQHQLSRAENLLSISAKNRGYGSELLAHYYSEISDDKEKALEILYGIEANARSARVMHKIARLEFMIGRFDKSLQAALEGYRYDPTMFALPLVAGASYLQLGNPREAVHYLEITRNLEPAEPATYSLLGNAYSLLDSLDKSLEAYKMLVRISPKDPKGLFNVAYLFYIKENYDSALVNIDKCLRVNPDYPDAITVREMILQEIGPP
jgi:tetratricopeptide (TPR) repeat protein